MPTNNRHAQSTLPTCLTRLIAFSSKCFQYKVMQIRPWVDNPFHLEGGERVQSGYETSSLKLPAALILAMRRAAYINYAFVELVRHPSTLV